VRDTRLRLITSVTCDKDGGRRAPANRSPCGDPHALLLGLERCATVLPLLAILAAACVPTKEGVLITVPFTASHALSLSRTCAPP
jgi:hypothetical protein